MSVRNISGRRLDAVRVAFDTGYVTRFSSVRFEPAPRIAYTVLLIGVEPGEARLVAVELSGERYGRHRGRIAAATASDTVVARVSTLVFP